MKDRAPLEEIEDDTVLGALRRHNAAHFVKAAKLAYDSDRGYTYLLDNGLYVRFRKAFGFSAARELHSQNRALAFCFMAAMVEAGDA